MALATCCPKCHALFRVVADQLKLRGGLVRCGACRHVFDAISTLSYVDDASVRPATTNAPEEPDNGPPSTLRIEPSAARLSATAETATEAEAEVDPETLDSVHLTETRAAAPAALGAVRPIEGLDSTPASDEETQPEPGEEALAELVDAKRQDIDATLQDVNATPQDIEVTPEPISDEVTPALLPEPAPQPPPVEDELTEIPAFLQQEAKPRRMIVAAAFALAAFVLGVALLLQLTILYRAELLAAWPGLRPALAHICTPLDCRVDWPARGDLLAIVGADLQAIPGASALELTAVVRNRASHTLALPAIELTLTDSQSRAIARKVFAPSDYLAADSAAMRIDTGFGAGEDLTIKLLLDSGDTSTSGFVVYPFYL